MRCVQAVSALPEDWLLGAMALSTGEHLAVSWDMQQIVGKMHTHTKAGWETIHFDQVHTYYLLGGKGLQHERTSIMMVFTWPGNQALDFSAVSQTCLLLNDQAIKYMDFK